MNKVGDLLKKTREEQGLSLEQVAQKTKIHIQKLAAIEEGRESDLPAKVFTIGLVKSYARLLKIEPKVIDELCVETYDFHPEVIEVAHLPNNNEPTETQPVGRFQISKALSIFLSIVISFGLIFIIYLVVDKMNSYSAEEEPITTKYVDPISTDEVAPKDTVEAMVNETTKINPEESTVKIESPKKIPESATSAEVKNNSTETKIETTPNTSDLKNKKETLAIVTENLKSTAKVPEIKNDATVAETDKKTSSDNSLSSTESQVIHSDNKFSIQSLEPVRVEIVWSDGYVQVMLLKSNETKTLVFSSPIIVKINNGGAVKVSFNDQSYRIPGQLNQPIELKYP